MRILHLIPNYFPSIGGSQLLMQRYSEELCKQFNDDVTIMTTDAMQSPVAKNVEHILPLHETINDVQVRRFPFTRYWRKPLGLTVAAAMKLNLSVNETLMSFVNGPISYSLFQAIRDSECDIIGAGAFNSLMMYYPIWIPQPRKPVVHIGLLHIHPNRRISQMILRAIRAADAYVALTNYERQALIANGVEAEKIHVVGAGVDPQKFSTANSAQLRKKYGIGSEPIVAYIGRIAIYKGIDTLVRAMQEVWKHCPEAYLLIAGRQSIYSSKLASLIEQLPMIQRERTIQIEDFSESEKPNIMAAADIFVSVSEGESFGITYLEAWVSGKPVIGCRIGAVQSVIDEGVDGLLVNYGNVPELTHAVLKLLGDGSLREKLAGKGKRKVLENYTWEITAQKLRKTYEHVLEMRINFDR